MKCILLFYLLGLALSDWSGNLTVVSNNHTYTHLTRIDSRHGIFLSGFLYSGDVSLNGTNFTQYQPLVNITQIWLTYLQPQDTLEQKLIQAKAISAKAAIFITDNFTLPNPSESHNLSETVLFTLSVNNSYELLEEFTDPDEAIDVKVLYSYICKLYLDECEKYAPLTIMYTAFTIAWFGFFTLWVLNNHWWNGWNSNIFHKLITIVILFKFLNMFSATCLWRSCPYESEFYIEINYQLLKLMQNQCRTLYETAFFSLLLILSKGMMLTRMEFTRMEFNYLALVLILVYILDSATNLLGASVNYVALAMYCAVLVHCIYFSRRTVVTLRNRLLVSGEVGVNTLVIVHKLKLVMFLKYISLMLSYFGSEALIHMGIQDFTAGAKIDWQQRSAINLGIHEAVEFLLISCIFYLYRAKDRDRFFDLDILEDDTEEMRLIPFYRASLSSGCCASNSSGPVAIITPGLSDVSNPYRHILIGDLIPVLKSQEIICSPITGPISVEMRVL